MSLIYRIPTGRPLTKEEHDANLAFLETSLQDLQNASGVLADQVSILPVSGLTYYVQATRYLIDGAYYSATPGNITLDTADATYDRIDAVYVDIYGNIGKKTGVAGTSLTYPDIDLTTEYLVRFILVKAGATTGSDVDTGVDIGYNFIWKDSDEGTWTFIESSANIEISTTDPINDTASILMTNALLEDKLLFISSEKKQIYNYSYLVLTYEKTGLLPKQLYFRFYNGTNSVAYLAVSNGQFGFLRANTLGYVAIPLTSFGFTNIEFDKIEMYGSGTGNYKLDDIALLAGGVVAGRPTSEQVQADFLQEDETAPDFIKNKEYLALNPAGFNNNLAPTDNTLQKIVDKFDAFEGGSDLDLQTSFTTTLFFDKNRVSTFGASINNLHTQIAPITFTYNFIGALEGSVRTLEILSNGDIITIPKQAEGTNILLNNSSTLLSIVNNEIVLEPDKKYLLMFWYSNGYVNCVINDAPTILNDIDPPTFAVAPFASNITQTSFDLEATINEEGTVYVVVLADGATPPTSTEVKNGTGSGGLGQLASGNAIDSGSGVIIPLTGLIFNTDYDIYVVGEDKSNNLMITPVKVDVLTLNSYVFSNNKHMLIDINGEGMTISNNELLPSNGAGVDSAVSFELWYKTPATMNVARNLMQIYDGAIRACFIGIIGSSNSIYFRFEAGNSSNYIQSQIDTPTLIADTLYHIVGTYNGNETDAGLTLYLNNSTYTNLKTTVGTYNGITTDKTSVVVQIPRTDAVVGLGQYQLFRQFSSELTSLEVSTLFNSGVPVGLDSSLQAKCVQENLFEDNLNAINIGINGVAIGTPTFGNN